MESQKLTSLIKAGDTIINIKIFCIPIGIMIFGMLYTLYATVDIPDDQLEQQLRILFTPFSFPFICIWIFNALKRFFGDEYNEMILSLPYSNWKHGIGRVGILYIMYMLLFFAMYIVILIFRRDGLASLSSFDLYFPAISIFYLAALSFVMMTVLKDLLRSYFLFFLYCIFQYITVGGYSKLIYPFHWAVPTPYNSNDSIAIVLIVLGIMFLVIAQIRFSRRDYLLKYH